MAGKVSAILVNFNGGEDLVQCLGALQEHAPSAEIVIVDNGSTDGSLEAARERFPHVKVVAPPRNLGFAGGANVGSAVATGDYLLFMNPDLFVEAGCVDALVDALEGGAGVAGPTLFVEASGRDEFGGIIDWFGYPEPLTEQGRPIYVPGCALATQASLFRELGGFDERYFMFVEDVDYCWRALLSGHDLVTLPQARALHKGGGATPGGYGKKGTAKTPTVFRFTMRERNSLAMLVKCLSPARLFAVVPLYLLQSLVTAAVAFALKPAVSIGIMKAIWWNAIQLPETLKRRRAIPKSRDRRRLLRGRVRPGSNKLKIVLSHGLPRFMADRGSQ